MRRVLPVLLFTLTAGLTVLARPAVAADILCDPYAAGSPIWRIGTASSAEFSIENGNGAGLSGWGCRTTVTARSVR